MAGGVGRSAGGFDAGTTYRRDENGDYVYHPAGQFRMTQQQATDANARNQAERNQTNASRTGGVYLEPVGGSGGYGGYGSGSGSSYGGGSGAGPVTGNPGSVVSSAGDAGGNINLSRDAYEAQQAMLLKSQLADKAFSKVSGQFGSSGGAGGHVNYGDSGEANAARAMAFARAKEQASDNAAAQLRTLQDIAGRRGIRGSTIEGDMISDAVQGGGQQIADFNTRQMGEDLDYITHVADTTYQGNITQRGQDQAAKQAMLSILAGLY